MHFRHRLLYTSLFVFLAVIFKSNAQQSSLSVNRTDSLNNTLEAIAKSLVGSGVEVLNIKCNLPIGSPAYGTFLDSKKSIGLKNGVLLTNGSIENAIGPNNKKGQSKKLFAQGDSLLGALISADSTCDACILELEIIPYADTLTFSYVFASEEYDEYVGSKYNDVFAFLIEGEGIEGVKNMALIPFTDIPVAINNVNNGNKKKPDFVPKNSTFYIQNTTNNAVNPNIQYDGYTKLLEVRQAVKAGSKYRLKLGITDVYDYYLDSGVFIEGKSLSSYFKTVQVNFGYDKYNLTYDEKKELNELVKFIKARKIAKVELVGHTDFKGEVDYNIALSKKRLRTVANYLVARGVKRSVITQNPRGESMPVADNETDEGRAKNRRVDIRLLPE